jgi:hypothetical protein
MPELHLSLSNAKVQLLHDRKSNAAHFGFKYPSFDLGIHPNHLRNGYAFKMTVKLGARQWYLYPGIKEHILELKKRHFYYPLFCEADSIKDKWSFDDDVITEIRSTLSVISVDAFTIKGTSKHNGFVYLEPKRLEVFITVSFEVNSEGIVNMSLPIQVKKNIVKMFKAHMGKIDKPTRAQIKEYIESVRTLDDPYDYDSPLPF